MLIHELWAKYDGVLAPERVPLKPVETDPTQVVMAYDKWIKNKCRCCGGHGCSGIWKCEFTNQTQVIPLCAACGLRGAYQKWNGFFSKHLLRIDLVITLTYQSNSSPED